MVMLVSQVCRGKFSTKVLFKTCCLFFSSRSPKHNFDQPAADQSCTPMHQEFWGTYASCGCMYIYMLFSSMFGTMILKYIMFIHFCRCIETTSQKQDFFALDLELRPIGFSMLTIQKPPQFQISNCPYIANEDRTVESVLNMTLWLCQNSYWKWP